MAAVAAALALHRLVLPLPLGLGERAGELAAGAAFVFGAGLIVSAMVLFVRSGQNPEPWKSTPAIILTGPYRISRNPMSLGMAALQAGAAFRFSNGWLLALLPLALLGVFRVAIRQEEEYLERKFGDSYRRYKASVRRWL